jgi:hypothetical protein
MQKWTKEEIDTLKTNHHLGPDNLCALFNTRTRMSVLSKAKRLGLSYRTRYSWNDQEDDKLRKLWPNATSEELRIAFPNIKHHALQEYARKKGIKRLVQYRKGTLAPLLEEKK